MKTIFFILIRIYQRVFSLDTGYLRFVLPVGGVCRFAPRCSEYTYQAVKRYGIIYGLYLGLKRILRCHPFGKGGLDPVP